MKKTTTSATPLKIILYLRVTHEGPVTPMDQSKTVTLAASATSIVLNSTQS